MRSDKQRATKLRQSGISYKKIVERLGVPKSTLSDWFSGKAWSEDIKRKNIVVAKPIWRANIKKLVAFNRHRSQQAVMKHRRAAKKEFIALCDNQLFIANLMLYWGEGTSHGDCSLVKLTNTNPRMIRLFTQFLIRICNIPKDRIRVGIIIYPDLNKKTCENFWSKVTKIPLTQFHKTQIIHGRGGARKLNYGICMVQVINRGLKERILLWIPMIERRLFKRARQQKNNLVSYD